MQFYNHLQFYFSIIDEKDHICLQDFKNDKRQIKRKFDFLFCQNSFAWYKCNLVR